MSAYVATKRILRFFGEHEIARRRYLRTLVRFMGWQVVSRLRSEVIVDWVGGARLVVSRGMTGATGNIYCGLHEFADMCFVLHFLKSDDLFIDVGANIGSYTVLAAKVRGTRCVAIEPAATTMASLERNVTTNRIGDRVRLVRAAVGSRSGEVVLTQGLDTMNRVLGNEGEAAGETVPVLPLDVILSDDDPSMIKMDIEGYETEALKGAGSTLSKASLRAVLIEDDSPFVRMTLEQAGFQRCSYDPWSRSLVDRADGGKAHNTLYVRRPHELVDRLTAAPRVNVLGVEV